MNSSLVVAALIALAPTPSLSQSTGTAGTGDPGGGGAEEALAAARDAQRRFERDRVDWIPVTHGWRGGRCDETLGRMCLRRDQGGDWFPGPEDARLRRGRDALLDTLEAVARKIPSDPWILGQRVAYLGEAGRWEEATAVARAACAAGEGDGWCRALEGLALHARDRFVDAERAFRAAFARMERDRVEEGSDPSRLLDGAGRRWWGRLDADARADASVRIWALSDPLLLVPGNDRLTEHWARWTLARTREDAANPYGMRWRDDLEALTLRYGRELGWDREFTSTPASAPSYTVVGRHHPESRPLMVPGEALRDPVAASRQDWIPDARNARAAYAPAYAPVLLPGAGQIAVFPRGERFVVVAAEALPEDTTRHAGHEHPGRDRVAPRWRGRPLRTGIFLVPVDGGADTVLASVRAGEGHGGLFLDAPAGRWVASLEIFAPDLRRAGRSRQGLDVPARPPDLPTLSDLLLLETEPPEGASLEEAAGVALPRGWLHAGEAWVVAWELFGLGYRPRETVAYRLSVEEANPGLLRRIGRGLGLWGPNRTALVEWEEAGPETPGPDLRWARLALPRAGPGRYRVRLEARLAGRSVLVRELEIEVRP